MNSLFFRPLVDASELSCFECGIEVMDNFIHNGLQESLTENNCSSYVVFDKNNNIVGFFSLMEDSLYLDEDEKDDLVNGYAAASLPVEMTEQQKTDFLGKTDYQVIDIAYLAVCKNNQRKGIGTAILNKIFEIVRAKKIYPFVTVDALFLKDVYRADTFYASRGFQRLYPPSSENTIRMYTTIF